MLYASLDQNRMKRVNLLRCAYILCRTAVMSIRTRRDRTHCGYGNIITG